MALCPHCPRCPHHPPTNSPLTPHQHSQRCSLQECSRLELLSRCCHRSRLHSHSRVRVACLLSQRWRHSSARGRKTGGSALSTQRSSSNTITGCAAWSYGRRRSRTVALAASRIGGGRVWPGSHRHGSERRVRAVRGTWRHSRSPSRPTLPPPRRGVPPRTHARSHRHVHSEKKRGRPSLTPKVREGEAQHIPVLHRAPPQPCIVRAQRTTVSQGKHKPRTRGLRDVRVCCAHRVLEGSPAACVRW